MACIFNTFRGMVARLAAASLVLLCVFSPLRAEENITVFAAASLKNALDEAAALYQTRSGATVRISYAGSAVLARQIAAGAPADLYISANAEWAEWVSAQDIEVHRRAQRLSNSLTLIAKARLEIDADSLGSALASARVAMALIDAVPAGIYGQKALENLGLWEEVKPRVVQSDHVRAALSLVALGAVPFGVVYRSDALSEPRVFPVYDFPENSHPQIIYPAMQLTKDGAGFFDFLQTPEVLSLFQSHGFSLLEST